MYDYIYMCNRIITVAGVKQTTSLQQSSTASTSVSAADATPKSTAVINTSRLKQPANKSMSDRDHIEVKAHSYYWCIHGNTSRWISILESPFWNRHSGIAILESPFWNSLTLDSYLIMIIKRLTM